MSAPGRLESGYRRYLESDVARLAFLRQDKTFGFSLVQIGELLGLSHHRDDDMVGHKAAASAKLAAAEAKLGELTRVRDGLRILVDACPGQGALKESPILHALAGEHA